HRVPRPRAADDWELTPPRFPKRMKHAPAAIVSFTRTYCGLPSDTAACACLRRVPAALRVGRMREEGVDFAGEASSYRETRSYVRRVEETRWALEVHRTSRPRASSVNFARRLVHALDPKA